MNTLKHSSKRAEKVQDIDFPRDVPENSFPILVVLQDNVPRMEMVVNLPSHEHIRIPKSHFTNSRVFPP